jgi:hypothetical protein
MMKVAIDSSIEKNPSVLKAVHSANHYLEDLLDTISDTVEAKWSVSSDQPRNIVLSLNSLDDIPTASASEILAEQLTDSDHRSLRVGAALRRFLDARGRVRARRLNDLLAELPD